MQPIRKKPTDHFYYQPYRRSPYLHTPSNVDDSTDILNTVLIAEVVSSAMDTVASICTDSFSGGDGGMSGGGGVSGDW